MNRDEIAVKFFSAQVICRDNTYGLPSTDWVFKKLVPFYKKVRFLFKMVAWTVKFDCDDHAVLFRFCGSVCHAITPGDDYESLAIGEFFYVRDDGVNHAINVIINHAGLLFIEPQTCKKIILTTGELNSCYLVLF